VKAAFKPSSSDKWSILRGAHYTAGASKESSVEHLIKPSSKASAHLVIGRDGSMTQLVPFNMVAWHAGKSRWHDMRGLNRYSIGIELDNVGVLEGGAGAWRSWFGRRVADDQVMVAAHKNETRERGWQRYSEAQIKSTMEASDAIVNHYKMIDVLGHDDITPARKQDPGPAFPMDQFQSRLVGRADDENDKFVTTTALNIRSGPGTNHDKLDDCPLAKGTELISDARHGNWHAVEALKADGTALCTGWVHGNYIAPAA
jgi:N-acetylmuramoyl-L-alanine amidase